MKLLLLILAIIHTTTSLTPITEVSNNVIKLISDSWDNLRKLDRAGKTNSEILTHIASSLSGIPPEINKIEKDLILYKFDESLKSLSKVKNTSTTQKWTEINSELSILTPPINILYSHFTIFPSSPESFTPNSTVFDLNADSIVNLILKPLVPKSEIITLNYMLDSISQTINNNSSGGSAQQSAFSLLNIHIEESLLQSNYCLWNSKTPQMLIYGFYATNSLIYIKSYVLINFAYMLRYGINGTLPDNNDTENSLQNRLNNLRNSALPIIKKSSSSYWKCDPIKYEKTINYDNFEELLQGYIENEKNMHHSGSCRQSCSEYNVVKSYCEYPDPETCHKHRICTGDLVDCKFVASDADVCLGEGNRRFSYIQYKKGVTYGDSSTKCPTHLTKRDSFWRFLYHCSNCFCLCDDSNSPTTIRHISLLPVNSDIKNNKIVTGVKFVFKNGILYLQIQEGEATSNGNVLQETTEWKEITEADKNNKTESFMLTYITRSLDLDDLIVSSNHVVTGVRFRVLGNHLNLEIRGTQINPKTGSLLDSSSYWVSNDNTPESELSREELIIDDPDVSVKSLHPSIPDSVSNQYVNFGASSLIKDAGQTTVPFVDVQEVVISPSVWLRGVGVYHKGVVGYGGFVGVRVFGYLFEGFL